MECGGQEAQVIAAKVETASNVQAGMFSALLTLSSHSFPKIIYNMEQPKLILVNQSRGSVSLRLL